MAAAQENRDPQRRREPLRGQRRQRRAHHALPRQRSEPEDQQRIEQEIQHHGAGHDHQRRAGFADAAHQRLEHRVDEVEDNADKGHPHEAERAGVDVGLNAEQFQQERRARIARRAERRRGNRDHHDGLRRDVIDPVLPPRAHILRRQRRAGDAEACAQRDHQKHERETDRHRRDRRRAQPPDPECIGQLVAGLQEIAEDDRDRETNQRAADRSLEKQFFAVIRHVARGSLRSRGAAQVEMLKGWFTGVAGASGLMVRDAPRGAPHHEGRRPHPWKRAYWPQQILKCSGSRRRLSKPLRVTPAIRIPTA